MPVGLSALTTGFRANISLTPLRQILSQSPYLCLWSQNFIIQTRIPNSFLDSLLSWSMLPIQSFMKASGFCPYNNVYISNLYFFHLHSSIFYLLSELLYKPINLSPNLNFFSAPMYLLQICKIKPSKVQLWLLYQRCHQILVNDSWIKYRLSALSLRNSGKSIWL